MDNQNFLTIAHNGSHELVIKKSRFIATLKRVSSNDEAEQFIAETSKQYHDATHNTYAYTIGKNDEFVKASDNGEPSGTAGVPELKALQLNQVKNVAVVVTRYFGGIKLGAGGLIRAYSNSVSEAIKSIGIVKNVLQQELRFTIAYKDIDKVNYYLEQHQIFVNNREFNQAVTFSIFIDLAEVENIKQELTALLQGKAQFSLGESRYNEVPIN